MSRERRKCVRSSPLKAEHPVLRTAALRAILPSATAGASPVSTPARFEAQMARFRLDGVSRLRIIAEKIGSLQTHAQILRREPAQRPI
jgi:hypothetical protein